MIRRCENSNDKSYFKYGGRGIKVCKEWRRSFAQFKSDMCERPIGQYSIERKDNNGDYCPENCKWADPIEQANNRRNSLFFSINEETKTLSQWAVIYKISMLCVYRRVQYRNWDILRALTTPPRIIEKKESQP